MLRIGVARESVRSAPDSPQRVQRQREEPLPKRLLSRTRMEYNAGDETVAKAITKQAQTVEVRGLDARRRFDFDSDHPAIGSLDDDIDLVPPLILIMMKARALLAPSELAA